MDERHGDYSREAFIARLRDFAGKGSGSFETALQNRAGIAVSSINNVVKGNGEFLRPTILKIARAYSINPAWWITGEGHRHLGEKIPDEEIDSAEKFTRRISIIINAFGPQKLSKATGYRAERISQLLKGGDTTRPVMLDICRATGYSLLWLLCGQGYAHNANQKPTLKTLMDEAAEYLTDTEKNLTLLTGKAGVKTLFARLLFLSEEHNSIKSLARAMGISEGSSSSITSRKNPPYAEVIDWCIKNKINLNWLFARTSEGEPYISEHKQTDETRGLILLAARLHYASDKKGIQLPEEKYALVLENLESQFLRGGQIPSIKDIEGVLDYTIKLISSP